MFSKKLLLICSIGLVYCVNAQVYYAGKKPARANANVTSKAVNLSNNILSVNWQINDNKIADASIIDTQLKTKFSFKGNALFHVFLQNNDSISSGEFELSEAPHIVNLSGNHAATQYASRLDGKEIEAIFLNKRYGIKLKWDAILRDSSNYIEQKFTFASSTPQTIQKVVLLELPIEKKISLIGYVDGSPLIYQNMFFTLEHPLSKVDTANGLVRSTLHEQRTIDPSHSFQVSSAWGVTPEGQLRRGFLYYTEHERAAPYYQFLHYNSWFDISWSDRKLNDSVCLDRIQLYADSLIIKRNTPMNAFLFDDGWDNDQTLWRFNKGFVDGFKKEESLANKYNAKLGVWISPWGGYDESKQRRLEFGKKQIPPFETNDNGFSLSGKHYYDRFKSVAVEFMKKYGVAIFKFDGIGNMDDAISVVKDSDSTKKRIAQEDFEALLKLTKELRDVNPSIYLSLTVGTWSSPFWLNYADVTWRSGEDNGQTGEGDERQRWLNYRDKEVYQNIVQRAPLYPLNAVMNHGICIAQNGLPDKYEKDDKNIADEIWSFFGSGTSLQEMYINPHLLSSKDWDCLAQAISWSRKNANILSDVHWVGGDPGKNEVYGYAAWNDNKGTLMLRNPSNKIQEFLVDPVAIFELPKDVSQNYSYDMIYNKPKSMESAGQKITLKLEPHQVLVMNGHL